MPVARDAGPATGAVIVLVTHRFASARAAALVVLIDGGGVVETGTHRELIQARGAYAELYEIQAGYFTKP